MRYLPLLLLLTACPPYHPPGTPEAWISDVEQASKLICTEEVVWVRNGDRYIGHWTPGAVTYSQALLEQIGSIYGGPASIGVLAHELGHQCSYAEKGSVSEQDADVHAGCVLAILWERPEPYIRFLGSLAADAEHPPLEDRKGYVWDGWNTCVERFEVDIPGGR